MQQSLREFHEWQAADKVEREKRGDVINEAKIGWEWGRLEQNDPGEEEEEKEEMEEETERFGPPAKWEGK